METPSGMAYTAVRRVGDDIWVRMSAHIPSNIVQVAQSRAYSRQESSYSPPWMIQWAVPIDDQNTLLIHYVRRHENETTSAGSSAMAEQPYGKERPYEDRQRAPGDYEAEVSQRPIAIHAMEHLGSADRGVIVVRNMLRQGNPGGQRQPGPQGAHSNRRRAHPHLRQQHSSARTLRAGTSGGKPAPSEDRAESGPRVFRDPSTPGRLG